MSRKSKCDCEYEPGCGFAGHYFMLVSPSDIPETLKDILEATYDAEYPDLSDLIEMGVVPGPCYICNIQKGGNGMKKENKLNVKNENEDSILEGLINNIHALKAEYDQYQDNTDKICQRILSSKCLMNTTSVTKGVEEPTPVVSEIVSKVNKFFQNMEDEYGKDTMVEVWNSTFGKPGDDNTSQLSQRLEPAKVHELIEDVADTINDIDDTADDIDETLDDIKDSMRTIIHLLQSMHAHMTRPITTGVMESVAPLMSDNSLLDNIEIMINSSIRKYMSSSDYKFYQEYRDLSKKIDNLRKKFDEWSDDGDDD